VSGLFSAIQLSDSICFTQCDNLTHTRLALVLFSQITGGVVHHKANDGVACAIRAWLKYDTALSAVV